MRILGVGLSPNLCDTNRFPFRRQTQEVFSPESGWGGEGFKGEGSSTPERMGTERVR